MTPRLLHAEWTKLRTVPSTAWLAAAIVASTVVLGALATASVNTSQCPSPASCFEDTTKLALTGAWLSQAVVVVLATLAITGEYDTRLIQTTFTVSPRRPAVLLSKAVVVVTTVVAAGALGVLGSVLAARLVLPANGFTGANGYPPLSLADGPTLRAVAGTVIYLGLIAALSVGIGALVRDTVAAITTVLSLLYLLPIIAQLVSDPVWSDRLQKLAPSSAGLAIQATANLDQLPIRPWPGVGVVAVYAGAALMAGIILVKVRDA